MVKDVCMEVSPEDATAEKKGLTVEVGYKGISSGEATARDDPKQRVSLTGKGLSF